ncbi:hypothetical protein FQN55_007255 [Onygenales sp. PD_40]|nr:hypothetical protein FQN55_007255 [Onygenales sp. PD_40]
MRFSNTIYTAAAGLLLASPAALAAPNNNNKPKPKQLPQFHNAATHAAADPYVLYDRHSGQYYAYSTEGADPGSLFGIYTSPDLSTWHKQAGGVLKACYDEETMTRLEGGQACWARDWHWAPETYYNGETGWYFFFFAGRLREELAAGYFRYGLFEEPSKIGVAVSRAPGGPFREIREMPIDWFPFDPEYHDVNLIMDEGQMAPPRGREEGETAPMGTFIPTIDANVVFDVDGKIYLYASRNAYRNWNWDEELGKYIEESNIIVVELERDWWDDPTASTMPEIVTAQRNIHEKDAPPLPPNITSYNGTGEIGHPPRMDGWKTVISYGADPQEWENFHVNDYHKYNGTRKDRRWSEGSSVLTRPDTENHDKRVYLLTYSANNFEASNYGVGFATASSPLGPFVKSAHNPVLSQLPDAEIPIYSTGHGSIISSPPCNGRAGEHDFTHRTPDGAELFYVHHGRNDTTQDRSIYTTRMTLDEKAMRVGSDDAITMHLTSLDQPLPRGTYPIEIEASCSRKTERKGGRKYTVRVVSSPGGSFDLVEASNRVVALPGDRAATSVVAEDGLFVLEFGDGVVRELGYQRLSVDGTWSTVVRKRSATAVTAKYGTLKIKMDPLSIAGSIAGLLTISGKLCSILNSIISSAHQAEGSVRWALAEITATKTAIAALQGILDAIESIPLYQRALIRLGNFSIILSEVVLAFDRLDRLIGPFEGLASNFSVRDQMKWTWNEEAIAFEIQQLQTLKSSLVLMLNILQCSSMSVAHESAASVQATVTQLVQENRNLQYRIQRLENFRADAEDDALTVYTARRLGHGPQTISPPVQDQIHIIMNPVQFEFQGELEASQPYRRVHRKTETMSCASATVRSDALSIFDKLTMADISAISVFALPLDTGEVENSDCYMPKRQDSMRSRNDAALQSVIESEESLAEIHERQPLTVGSGRYSGEQMRKRAFGERKRNSVSLSEVPGIILGFIQLKQLYDAGLLNDDLRLSGRMVE